MTRTGLAAETCTHKLAQEMAAIPALTEAFKDAVYEWKSYQHPDIWDKVGDDLCRIKTVWSLDARINEDGEHEPPYTHPAKIPAPTCREMLAWLRPNPIVWQEQFYVQLGLTKCADMHYDITEPDALARACIEASRP